MNVTVHDVDDVVVKMSHSDQEIGKGLSSGSRGVSVLRGQSLAQSQGHHYTCLELPFA